MTYYITLKKAENNGFYFTLQAGNRRTLMTSEVYNDRPYLLIHRLCRQLQARFINKTLPRKKLRHT